MDSAEQYLVDETGRLVRLFTPPFDHSQPNPGYIMGYPPGLRENGGQYTHGSLWMAMAWARLGDGGRAVHLLELMNPVELSRSPEDVARYRGEPYVTAADVSSAPGMTGRCGWTWYTGSAAWMYRIWIEEVLGFHLHGDTLTISPVTPADWPGFEMTYRYRSATYQIAVTTEEDDSDRIAGGSRWPDTRRRSHPLGGRWRDAPCQNQDTEAPRPAVGRADLTPHRVCCEWRVFRADPTFLSGLDYQARHCSCRDVNTRTFPASIVVHRSVGISRACESCRLSRFCR